MSTNNLDTVTTAIDIFMAELQMRLASILGFARLFPRNTNIGEYAQHGQTLHIPDVEIMGGLTEREVGGAATASDTASTSKPVSMKHYFKGIKIDNLLLAITNVDLLQRFTTDLAAIAGEGIDAILFSLWKEIPYQVGKTDGTLAFNATDKLSVLADARTLALRNKWGGVARYGVLTPDEGNGLTKLEQLLKVSESGSSDILREGRIGKFLGWDLAESNTNDVKFTLGTTTNWGATPLVKGVHALGVDAIVVDGLGTGTLPAGSIFTVGGHAYTVKTTATITANEATIVLNEKLRSPLADNDPVTPTLHSGAGTGISLLFRPDAFLVVNRPMPPLTFGGGGGNMVERYITDKASGFTFRVLFESQGQGAAGDAYSQKITLDILFGAIPRQPKWSIRLAGK